MESENVRTAKSFLEENHRGSVADSMKKYCTDDFVWWVSGYGEVQDSIAETVKAMRGHFTGKDQKSEVVGVTSDGDRVALEVESSRPLTNGTVYANRYHNLFIFRGGKIAVMREYHNSAHARDIWAPIFAQS